MSEFHEVAPFDPTKKKKKKKVNLADVAENSHLLADEGSEVKEGGSDHDNHLTEQPLNPSELISIPTDQDYLYGELLERIFGVISIKSKMAMRLPVPEVLRQGTKKTVVVNFLDFCKTMHRKPEHLQDYLEAELASNAALDGKLQLVINGRFQVKHIESILRKYANEYVICNGCKSPETVLTKENRLMFVTCENCGSTRTVAAISRGFQAPIRRARNSR
ncbi:eukaryotic translation initiation factor 2 subunit beta-like [Silene latifolia]|uniref:eukaryotic translation initiation factor 2 subunit beta-like n=1 Tax=Silene latifolia TaxID=37657 RepID=UPI003D78A84D